MHAISNDNGETEVQFLEARFHPKGRADEYVLVGTIVCRGSWAACELVTDLGRRLPESCSSASIATNVRYLTIMSRPRPFETLLAIDSQYWSFVPGTAHPSHADR